MKKEKFVDVIKLDDWEIETDSGWEDVHSIGKTIPFNIWEIETEKGLKLHCADIHILFDENMDEVYIKDCKIGTKIQTKFGIDKIKVINETKIKEKMFDMMMTDETNHRFYSNDILSHNSLVLGNLAVNLQRNGYNVLVVSLELSEKKYLKRIAANIHNIPIAEYDLFIEDKKKLRKKIENHTQMDGITMKIPGKLIIKEFPADSLKVSELEAYIFKLESQLKINFDVLIVDYLNLLVDYKNPSSESTYLKVKNIAVSLRALAMRKNLAAISATQATRGASEKSGALSMADVSESIGLPQTVDALFSISKDMMDQANNTLTFGAVALRDAEGMGETRQFDFDKKYLRITQKLEDCNQNLNLDCFSLMG